MGIFSKFEGKVDDAFDGMAGSVFKSPIEPTQIAKRCEKEMSRNKLVGKGVQYAPTLYTVLVNNDDDRRLFGFYPTMAGELETYLVGAADDLGLRLECRPLVRFIADDGLKSGKFDVIAEVVTSSIIAELREEEAEYYGLDDFTRQSGRAAFPARRDTGRPKGTSRKPVEPRIEPQPEPEDIPVNRNVDFSGLDAIGTKSQPDDLDAYQPPMTQSRPGADAAAGMGAAAAMGHAGYNRSDDGYEDYEDYGAGNQPAGHVTSLARGNRVPYGYEPAILIDARTGAEYVLDYDDMVLGREDTCDIALPDVSISREHARMVMDNMGVWSITDLGSTNGTSVNGRRINNARLTFGDQITLGTTVLLFQKG